MTICMKNVWVIEGEATDSDVFRGKAKYGQRKYRFTYGPKGWAPRGNYYFDLAQGLREHSGCIIHWES